MLIINVFPLIVLLNSYCYSQIIPKIDTTKHIDVLWQEFKEKFNKTYYGHHDVHKKLAFHENMKRIHKHNEEAAKGIHSYTININHLTDLSPQAYLLKMVKLTHSPHRKLSDIVGSFSEKDSKLPVEVDWRKKGFETPNYNQEDCGSCYAFSIAHVLAAQVFKQTDKLVPLSEQQLVDCSILTGNYGCGGGSLRNTLRYLEKSGGLMTYHDYPYVAKQRICKFDKNKAIVNITQWAILPARDERAMEAAIAKIGPIAASINASPHTFQLYHSGIYDDPTCSSNTVNHAMLIVGYTKDAWILKNWWGRHWGDNGYMLLKKNKNKCGIANYVAYAVV